MNGLYRGAFIVVVQHTVGGQVYYDIGYIKGGNGTVSEPWKLCSAQTWKEYSVSAREVAKDSYYSNGSLAEAELIYKGMAGNSPTYATKPGLQSYSDFV